MRNIRSNGAIERTGDAAKIFAELTTNARTVAAATDYNNLAFGGIFLAFFFLAR
jgi:hypothetical protein